MTIKKNRERKRSEERRGEESKYIEIEMTWKEVGKEKRN